MTNKRTAPAPYVQPYRYPSPHIPMAAIRRFAGQIAERFHPDKIILFGSYAYGQPHAESDVDLLVIMDAYDVVNQAIRICAAFERIFSHDIIVRTPKQIERGLQQNNWFLREIIEKGKVLYDTGNDPVGALRRRGSARRKGNGRKGPAAAKPRVLSLPTVGGKVPQSPAAGTSTDGRLEVRTDGRSGAFYSTVAGALVATKDCADRGLGRAGCPNGSRS